MKKRSYCEMTPLFAKTPMKWAFFANMTVQKGLHTVVIHWCISWRRLMISAMKSWISKMPIN